MLERLKRIVLLLSILFITGCASTTVTSKDSLKLSLGLTKAEVLEILGDPQRVSATSDGREIYEYDITGVEYQSCMAAAALLTIGLASGDCVNKLDALTVIFINGKVSAYKQIETD